MTDGTITHVVAGGGPPLLLLNGGLMSLRAWDALAAPLETSFTVIRCDLRGQLLTPGPAPATLDGHADDVARLIAHLGFDSVHVAGTSFGALVGTTLAARHPALVRSLVAMNATARLTADMRAGALMVRNACQSAIEGGDGGAVFDLIVPATFSPEYRHAHASELAQRRALIAMLPRAWFEGVDALLASMEQLDLVPLLPEVRCPVLVLAGGRDETFPPASSQALAAELRHARISIVPGGSHGMVIEEPGTLAPVITAFVRGAETRAASEEPHRAS
jgi:3-oxoadipate enol-lactonase